MLTWEHLVPLEAENSKFILRQAIKQAEQPACEGCSVCVFAHVWRLSENVHQASAGPCHHQAAHGEVKWSGEFRTHTRTHVQTKNSSLTFLYTIMLGDSSATPLVPCPLLLFCAMIQKRAHRKGQLLLWTEGLPVHQENNAVWTLDAPTSARTWSFE